MVFLPFQQFIVYLSSHNSRILLYHQIEISHIQDYQICKNTFLDLAVYPQAPMPPQSTAHLVYISESKVLTVILAGIPDCFLQERHRYIPV